LARIKEIVPENVSRVHVTQPEALGLGHAVLCAESVVGDEPFAILLADDMIRSQGRGALAQMVDVHDQTGASVIGVEEIPQEMTRSYGIVGVNHAEGGLQEIHTIVEKPAPEDAPSRLGVVGRYVLSPDVFSCLRDVQAGAGGEIQLTDGIAAMLKSHKVLACPFSGVRYDCGSRQGFIKATIDYALDHHDLRDDILEHMSGILVRYSGQL
jgi:UTP--glucose-1-phosphate uridylyltransferase